MAEIDQDVIALLLAHQNGDLETIRKLIEARPQLETPPLPLNVPLKQMAGKYLHPIKKGQESTNLVSPESPLTSFG